MAMWCTTAQSGTQQSIRGSKLFGQLLSLEASDAARQVISDTSPLS
jgi:hypothetical protein